MENPQLLKDVYEASQDSANSAMAENEKYLDSVTGKMQQMQNRLQEMANLAIDSDSLKGVLDILNSILGVVTQLVETFGTLPSILGVIGGLFAQKNGLGRRGKPHSRIVARKMPTLLYGTQCRIGANKVQVVLL